MRDAELRALYLGTTWSVRISGGTLRLAPGTPAPRPLRPSAVVTAYNPFSHPATPAENRAAFRRLAARARGPLSRAHGTGPERLRWSEPGVVLLGPGARDAAVALGEEFRQNAILAVDEDGRVSIVATRAGFCGRGVGEEIQPHTETQRDAFASLLHIRTCS